MKLLEFIRLLKWIDGLAFKEPARIKIKLWGRPKCTFYMELTGSLGRRPKKEEYYEVPIFFNYCHRTDSSLRKLMDPLRTAMHEVRHRVQNNYPKINLFTIEDLPASLQMFVKKEAIAKLNPEEIDAQIFDTLARPILIEKDIHNFLIFLFKGTTHEPKSG